MSQLQIFENPEFGAIRTTQDEKGNVLFGGTDVAKSLGYGQPHKAVERHCRYGMKRTVPHPQNANKLIEMVFIPESDVYRLIVKSKLPSAEKFERWMFEEVLPSIRKYGGYITWTKLQQFFSDPDALTEFLKQMLRLTEENSSLKSRIDELAPKGEYFDKIIDTGLLVNFRTTANEMGVRPHYLVNFLLDKKYLYRNTKKELLPYQKHIESGFFELVEYWRNGHTGVQTLITPHGRQHLLKLYFDGDMEVGEF